MTDRALRSRAAARAAEPDPCLEAATRARGIPMLPWLIVVTLTVSAIASTALGAPIGGDFSVGLDDWTTQGDVTIDAGAARLSDEDAFYSSLYQPVALDGGVSSLSFDFKAELSESVPGGPFGFPDTFFATLYLTDQSDFDPLSLAATDAIALFDADRGGVAPLSGSVTASTSRAGWLTYVLEFETTRAFAVPIFELFDQNFIPGDSRVWIDDVVIAPVEPTTHPIPEPSAALLMASGALTVALRLKSTRREQG